MDRTISHPDWGLCDYLRDLRPDRNPSARSTALNRGQPAKLACPMSVPAEEDGDRHGPTVGGEPVTRAIAVSSSGPTGRSIRDGAAGESRQVRSLRE
jgi:hypothetical protein